MGDGGGGMGGGGGVSKSLDKHLNRMLYIYKKKTSPVLHVTIFMSVWATKTFYLLYNHQLLYLCTDRGIYWDVCHDQDDWELTQTY